MALSNRCLRSCFLIALLTAGCGGEPPAPPADASADAPVPDTGAACTSDAECDDGLFCNGAERCASSACARGTPVACDDAIPCTIDVCSEDVRACVSRPPDVDRDGAADRACLDASGTPLGSDCADDDANRFPGNEEICDAAMHDEDCDEATHGASDVDDDGFEDERCCNGAACGDDCNDTRAGAHPGAIEVCNLVDDDCNGAVDEGVATPGFVDADRDGYGDGSMPISACGTASGFSPYGTDCADDVVARSPGQAEFCDSVDNDCDTLVDEGAGSVVWYADLDGDGFGSAASGMVSACVPPAAHSLLGTDCNDSIAAVSPAAAELCDGIDNDCNGTADFVIATGDLEDDDGDGIADSGCGGPRGLDCDDRDASSGPSEAESCDGRDNDCDTRVDEGATSVAFFRDEDGDGFGSDAALMVACAQPSGYSRRGGDCDDASIAIRPGSTETCNAVDEDCDGAVDEGGAGSMCSIDHATSVCLAGSCAIGVCDPGFADCSAAPGCESDVLGDAAHCGSCAGCSELGSMCAMGVCRPTLDTLVRLGSPTSTDAEIVNEIAAVPGSSDMIVVGAFRGSLAFGGTVLTSLGGLDGFAARVRPDGSAMWAERWGGTDDDEMTAIGIEATTGALVLGGNLCGPQSLCGGPIGTPGICIGFWQRFGNVGAPACNYATILDATGGSDLRGIAIQQSGGQMYVYPGGAVRGSSTALAVASTLDYEGYVARFREVSGTVREWTRLATSLYVDTVSDVALDGAGHILAVGTSAGSVDFGLGPQAFSGYSDPFVMSLAEATGAPVTGRFFGAGGASYDEGRRIVVDGTTVYVAGTFGDSGAPSTLFVSASVTAASHGGRDAYVVAFDGATFAPRWATAVGGAQDDMVVGLTLAGGNVVLTGGFRGSMAFGSGSFVSDGGLDGFAFAVGPTGAPSWARQARGPFDEASVGAALLGDGRLVWMTHHDLSLTVLGSTLVSTTSTDVAVAYLAL